MANPCPNTHRRAPPPAHTGMPYTLCRFAWAGRRCPASLSYPWNKKCFLPFQGSGAKTPFGPKRGQEEVFPQSTAGNPFFMLREWTGTAILPAGGGFHVAASQESRKRPCRPKHN